MATVYSLIVWGGKNGTAVTSINAGTDTITLNNHGLRTGTAVVPQSTVSGVTSGTTYYARSTGTNTFTLHTSEAGANANTGLVDLTATTVFTLKAKAVIDYMAAYPTRWGAVGSERIYASLTAWNTARVAASAFDNEVCEIGMAWDDYRGDINFNVPAASALVTSMLDGARTSAYHGWVIGAGYINNRISGTAAMNCNSYRLVFEGFTFQCTPTGAGVIDIARPYSGFRRMLIIGPGLTSTANGVFMSATGAFAEQCLVKGFNRGIVIPQNTRGIYAHHNLVTGCNVGFSGVNGLTSSILGIYYNNISIGNTTNWLSVTGTEFASNNAGLAGEAWVAGSGVRITMATTDFFNYAGGGAAATDYQAATVTSAQVENGVAYLGAPTSDALGNFIPSYSGSAYGTAVTAGSFVEGLSYTIASVGSTDFTAIGALTNAVTFTDTGDTVGWTAHSLNDGDYIYFSVITTTTGISINTGYYVVGKAANTFQVALTAGGSAIALTTNGTGTVVLPTFKATGVGTGTGTATLNAKVDIGPYEYDLGYGAWPNNQDTTLSGYASGSRIKIAKQSDGTEIYNTTSPSWPLQTSYALGTDTPVYIYARKGSSAPFYKPLKLSATIDDVTGLTYDMTGLQIEDIARGASYTAGVATDWTINLATGAITHTSGTTRYSVQDLYSYHQDYSDDSATVDDNPAMDGTTPTQFELINSGSISAGDLEDLFGGSIELTDGQLYSNVYNVGTLTGSPTIYIYQGTTPITPFWSAGDIDILLKVANAGGGLISSGNITGYVRKFGYTYDHYEVSMGAGGRNVMPLSTSADASITSSEVSVSGRTDVTVTFDTYTRDFGDVHGDETYYCEVDCNNRPLSEVYEYLQYICREGAAGTLNGVAAATYQKAHSSVTNVIKAAPFGTYAGGFFTAAPTVWLKNVQAGESYKYILTDAAGNTHQNDPPANGLTINDLVAGSTVRVYETGTTTLVTDGETTNSGTSFVVAGITGNVDYTIQKDGYDTIRVVNQAVSGATVVSGLQKVDRAFQPI